MEIIMRKNALLAALITLSAASNAAAVQVYGKANVSLNHTDASNSDTLKLNSNASRIGVKGSYEVSEGLKAIYKFEYETFIDDGDDGSGDEFKQRNIYAGFQGGFGTIIAGKHDTPTKLAQGKIDLFNDLPNADIKNLIQGENRVSNIVMYSTPKTNGLKATVAFVPGDDTGGGEDGISSAVSYESGDLSVTLAYDDGTAIDSSVETLTRLAAEYKIGNAKFGALFQQADEVTGNEEDGYILSSSYKLANGVILKGQYGESDDEATEKTQIAVGADYKLNKKSKLFAYYSDIETETSTSSSVSTYAVGYEIKF
jgi:predicted porin